MELYHHGIKGMKWGVRRYQNKDGSLTAAGQKRYDRDVRENNMKKKESRAVIDGPDPNRWVREDIDRTKKIVDAQTNLVKELKRIEQETSQKSKPQMPNVAQMSNKELKDYIDRKLLEQQYKKLFSETSPAQVSKGRQIVNETLDVAGKIFAITGSALALATTMKQLKG